MLSTPFTNHGLSELLRSRGKVSVAYLYRGGCRINSWRAVEKSSMNPSMMLDPTTALYKSAATGETPAPAFGIATREALAAELERNSPVVETCVGQAPLRGNVLGTVLLDVASMFFLLRRRAEPFPSPASLARWRTQRFLGGVTVCSRGDGAVLGRYLRDSASALSLRYRQGSE